MNFFKNKKNNGFTLLFAVITVSIVLAVGLGVYNLLLKEMKFSGFVRESQMAFYAADSGIECIFYWDIKMKSISTTTPSDITCVNQTKSVGGAPVSSFTLDFDNGACAVVTIDKTNPTFTKLESRGYNTCNLSNPRRVERGIRATY